MSARSRARAATLALSIAFAAPRAARAEPFAGAHGRFQGDLDLAVGVGPELATGGLRAAAAARIIYLETAALYLGYADALGAERPVRRSFSIGVGVRPLFLPRWGSNLERGPEWLDLTIDSVSLDLGVFVNQRARNGWASTPGLEAGLGAELPLLGRASGPFLGVRGALRWDASALAASSSDDTVAASGLVTLTWHLVTAAHLVDLGDAALR